MIPVPKVVLQQWGDIYVVFEEVADTEGRKSSLALGAGQTKAQAIERARLMVNHLSVALSRLESEVM